MYGTENVPLMLIRLYEQNPSARHVKMVADILRQGGTAIYPTDSVYGLGCDLFSSKAIDRVAQIKGIKPEKAYFSVIFADLSHLSDFTLPLNNNVFKLMRRNLPGPFTFILPANHNVPKILKGRKKTIGIRIPDNRIILDIVRELGHPLVTTSVHDDDAILEYTTDPELIYEKYGKMVDVVVHGGYGHNVPTTIIDCTDEEPVIVREGLRMPEL